MHLSIDASNIRPGGGVTHLVELLRAADRLAYGFSQVIVWGGQATSGNGHRRCSALSLQGQAAHSVNFEVFIERIVNLLKRQFNPPAYAGCQDGHLS